MGRRVVWIAMVAALAACGGGSDEPPPPPALSVRSQAATSAQVSCEVQPPQLPFPLTVQGAWLALGFSSRDGVCAASQAGQVQAGTTVTVAVIDAGLSGTFAITPGTYAVTSEPPPLSGTTFRGALGAVTSTDATCAPGAAVSAAGTLVLSAIDAAGARGSVDLALRDAAGRVVQALRQPFDAPACAFAPDVCCLAQEAAGQAVTCPSRSCVP